MEKMDYALTVYFFRKDDNHKIYKGFEATFDTMMSAEVSIEYVADKWPDICYSKVAKDGNESFYFASGKNTTKERLSNYLISHNIHEVEPSDTDKICTCK